MKIFAIVLLRYGGIAHAHRRDWERIQTVLDLGAHTLRIGFNDSAYLHPDTIMYSNALLVERCVNILKSKGVQPAAPDVIWRMLRISAI